jgi:sugar lactone lactonase YvrE
MAIGSRSHRHRFGLEALGVGAALSLLGLPLAREASAAVLSPREIMPVGQVRPGMKGYGLTVFRGTKIERFGFEVISVMPKMNSGRPLILVRLSGGPITGRGAFGIQGMSGSPCYVNNRLIGAFAYAYAFPKEPVGMLTPIEDMAEALDPNLPTQLAGMSAPVVDVSQALSAEAPPTLPFAAPPPTLIKPLGLPVMVSGVSPRFMDRISQFFAPFNMAATPGPGRMAPSTPTIRLGPGSALAVSLLTGDIDMTGVGTVTYRRGKELLAFGHPMFQLGATNFPVTTAFVHDVISGMQVSFKMASPVQTVGTLFQDRPFSVAARVGAAPSMVPITCVVNDQGTGRSRTYKVRAANHPLLISRLLPIAANQAIFEVHGVPGDTTADVDLAIDTAELGTIRRQNVFFDGRAIDVSAVADLLSVMSILNDNAFRRINVKGVRMNVRLTPRRRTAVVERILVPQDRFEPGDTVDVGVVLRPYRGEPFTTRTSIRIPENAAAGRATLIVSGGPTPPPAQSSGGGGGSQGGSTPPPALTSVPQLLRRFLERERNDQMVTRVQFTTTAVSVNGEPLAMLPAHVADAMRSGRASGARSERDEVKSVRSMEYVLAGAQSVAITIESRVRSDKAPASGGSSSSGSRSESASYTVTTPSSISAIEDDSDEGMAETGPLPQPLPGAGRGVGPLEAARGSEPSRRSEKPSGEKSVKPGKDVPAAAPAGEAKEESDEGAVISRKAKTWRQTSAAEFEKGALEGLAVTSRGELRIAPALRLHAETGEQFVWSVAAVGSEVYAGTGNTGVVYRVGASGKAEPFFRSGELEVHALAKDKAGNLYAGTSPNGKLYRIRPDGHADELMALRADTLPAEGRTPATEGRRTAAYVMSIAVSEDGTVFAGTGPEGRVYRIAPQGKPTVLFKTADRFVQSLLVAPDGVVYAGTAESGLLYAIRPDGTARVVLDTDANAVTGLARDENGNLYAATAGGSSSSVKGTVVRISPQGDVKTLWDKSKSAVTALARDSAGNLYASSGAAIVRIEEDGEVVTHSDAKRGQFMALDAGARGEVVAGSVNVGAVYRLEPARMGAYESVVHDTRLSSRWGELRWLGRAGEGDTVRLDTRSGDSPEPDATWSAWIAIPDGAAGGASDRSGAREAGGGRVMSPAGRYVQYRVTLTRGAEAGPVLQEVSLSYLPRNSAPSVAFSAPAGGEFWKGSQTVKWTGTDADKDTLTYEVSYSRDGVTWTPVGKATGRRADGPTGREAATTSGGSLEERLAANPALARFRQALADDPEATAESRKQADELIAKFDGEKSATGPEAAKSEEKKGQNRESSISWDTAQLPDGVYRLRVVASDRPSNGEGALTGEVVSEPVLIVNKKPGLYVFRKTARRDDSGMLRVDGLVEARAPIAGAQFRIDGGDWNACEPADGIWDSTVEGFTLATTGMSRGEHKVEVKVSDLAGNTVSKTVTVGS